MSAGFGLVFDADCGIFDMLSEEDTPAKANSHYKSSYRSWHEPSRSCHPAWHAQRK